MQNERSSRRRERSHISTWRRNNQPPARVAFASVKRTGADELQPSSLPPPGPHPGCSGSRCAVIPQEPESDLHFLFCARLDNRKRFHFDSASKFQRFDFLIYQRSKPDLYPQTTDKKKLHNFFVSFNWKSCSSKAQIQRWFVKISGSFKIHTY